MKPNLLVIELWGLGDLMIATPFLRAASEYFHVTLLAKPLATDLQPRFWPGVKTVSFVAPWTAFEGKYHFWRWPWRDISRLRRQLADEHFSSGLSARWDPRDHLFLQLLGVKKRLGFPRAGSRLFLTQPLLRPDLAAHRYEFWRIIGKALNLELPSRDKIFQPVVSGRKTILIHTGAGQTVRVWPLERYQRLAARLRRENYSVQIICDPRQREWWLRSGETQIMSPTTVKELIALIDHAGLFMGNDSGVGHLAAFCGVPTFTLFGPQLPEWFAPLHPQAEWIEGKPCPYKPCWDYCRFSTPHCLWNISEEEVWMRLGKFVRLHLQN